jgi:hypothetical protein
MANYSIPNSIPAIGRISMPLSRQSRKQNSVAARCGPFNLAAVNESWVPRLFNTQLRKLSRAGSSTPNAQHSIQTVGRWMLDVGRFLSCGRVKGAWWSSRSSKPLSVPRTGTEVGSIPILSAFSVGLASSQSYRQGCRFHKGGD